MKNSGVIFFYLIFLFIIPLALGTYGLDTGILPYYLPLMVALANMLTLSGLEEFQDLLNWNRNNYNEYLEVYLKVNQSILEHKRDFKGIYKKKKNVIGKDIPFPEPLIPDIIINNNEDLSNFSPLINDIIDKIKKKYKNFI